MASEVAAVFSLGNTEAQCLYALERILPEETCKPDLFILYGEPAPKQRPSPLDAVARLKPQLEAMGLETTWRTMPGFSLDAGYRVVLALVQEISRAGYRKVYLGITGGTNPMVAALFHAGMTELSGEVVPIYVQGSPTDAGTQQQSIEMIRSTAARDSILIDRVLGLARAGQIRTAAVLAADLPKRGQAGFLREALELLSGWDQFDYSVAARMTAIGKRCEAQNTGRLGAVAGTLLRYIPIAERASSIESVLKDPAQFAKRAQQGWRERLAAQAVWLPLDALANAQRRSTEGAFTDAAMRAYRAVELALQYRLFRLGVHPSDLRWQEPPLAAAAEQWMARYSGDLPTVVAFEQSARMLELLEGEKFAGAPEMRRRLQSTRNSCYLEHGYLRVGAAACASCLETARSLCAAYLDLRDELGLLLDELAMRF